MGHTRHILPSNLGAGPVVTVEVADDVPLDRALPDSGPWLIRPESAGCLGCAS